MNNTSIIDEIRGYRENHARTFGFDLDRIVEDTRRAEERLRSEGWNVVRLKATRKEATGTIPSARHQMED